MQFKSPEENRKIEQMEKILADFPTYPSPIHASRYVELLGLELENPFDPTTWINPEIQTRLLKALSESSEKSGIRKCLATVILKPKFPVITKHIKLAPQAELKNIVTERIKKINQDMSAMEAAGDDMAQSLKESLTHWLGLLNGIDQAVGENDLEYLEELALHLSELAEISQHPAKIKETLGKLESLLAYFYSSLYFPNIRSRKKPLVKRAA